MTDAGAATTTAELFSNGGRIGEISVFRVSELFEIRHRDDEARAQSGLQRFEIEAAGEIAKYDDSGAYRPLKTAPNLRHGWRIECRTARDVRAVIDEIYPGRITVLAQVECRELVSSPLRATLARQSGMYKVAANISDEQIDHLVARVCRSDGGCLRTIFWQRDVTGATPSTKLPPSKFESWHDQTGRGERCAPLVCQEACNILVGEARKMVKGAAPTE